MSLDDILQNTPQIMRGMTTYYNLQCFRNLLNVNNSVLLCDFDLLPFYITPSITYELYEYELIVERRCIHNNLNADVPHAGCDIAGAKNYLHVIYCDHFNNNYIINQILRSIDSILSEDIFNALPPQVKVFDANCLYFDIFQ